MITREKAWKKVNELIDNQNLVKHCLAVEAAMLGYADYFGVGKIEKEKWAVAGLVHDADWEKYPDKHPQIILAWLKENSAGGDLVNAVAAHGVQFGVEPESQMAKTLRAVDELTGLIVAVALVRKSRKLMDVSVESVLKKWNDKAFAKGVNREDIERACRTIDISLDKHIRLALASMQTISTDLGL